MDLFVYLKIVIIVVSLRTRDLAPPPIEKGAMIFTAAIPIHFQIVNHKTRRRSKSLKGSQGMGVGAKLSENLRAPPFN